MFYVRSFVQMADVAERLAKQVGQRRFFGTAEYSPLSGKANS
jgi:hypothetical protein